MAVRTHTSIRDTLNGSINEGCGGAIRIEIDNVNSVALRGVRVHQDTRHKNGTMSTINQISDTRAVNEKRKLARLEGND